jgi:hypothetical protein
MTLLIFDWGVQRVDVLENDVAMERVYPNAEAGGRSDKKKEKEMEIEGTTLLISFPCRRRRPLKVKPLKLLG